VSWSWRVCGATSAIAAHPYNVFDFSPTASGMGRSNPANFQGFLQATPSAAMTACICRTRVTVWPAYSESSVQRACARSFYDARTSDAARSHQRWRITRSSMSLSGGQGI